MVIRPLRIRSRDYDPSLKQSNSHLTDLQVCNMENSEAFIFTISTLFIDDTANSTVSICVNSTDTSEYPLLARSGYTPRLNIHPKAEAGNL